MMMLDDLDLLQLMPELLRSDPVTIALCKAFEPVFAVLTQQMRTLLIYTRIDQLSGQVLDDLAWGWDVSWYDPTDTLAARRETIKTALQVFSRMGTAGALKQAVSAAFGDANVSEWWQYDGAPGHFRIEVEDPSATTDRAKAFLKTVDAVKNVRSHLDQIILMKLSDAPHHVGVIPVITKKIRSEQIG